MRQVIIYGLTEWINESTGGLPRVGELIILPNGYTVEVRTITRDINKQVISINCTDGNTDSDLIRKLRDFFNEELFQNDWRQETFMTMFDRAAKRLTDGKK